MAWFRRRRRGRVDVGRYVAPESFPEPTVEELVEEGLLIAASAVRLAVANQLILRALRDRDDYDEAHARELVRAEMIALADEKDDDAQRLAATRVAAGTREGVALHQYDYRAADTALLARREKVVRALAGRLRRLSEDGDYVAGVVARAHERAWDEVSGSLEAVLARTGPPADPEEYRRHRAERMRLVATVDLSELALARLPEY